MSQDNINEEPNDVNKVYQGHVLDVLKSFPDNFVDCVVTSPPYWSLRSYGTEPQVWDSVEGCEHEWGDNSYIRNNDQTAGAKQRTNPGSVGRDDPVKNSFCLHCQAWQGELGLEPTFQLYLKHLIDVFREVKRVVKKTGSIWVNLGDSYSGSGGAGGDYNNGGLKEGQPKYKGTGKSTVPSKSLCGIPERFAIAMTDELGLIRRNTIIWHKPNCMPSSAQDRFTVDFEYMYFFTKSQKYCFERQFEPHKDIPHARGDLKNIPSANFQDSSQAYKKGGWNELPSFHNPLGRNKRCVWTIPTQASSIEHYAQFQRI